MTERRADDATRDVEAWLKCFYMRDHLGSVFAGTVSSVTSFGMFVSLDDLYVEGLVHISELGKDYFHFEAAKHQLLGERTGQRYRLGDRVRVRVVKVDMESTKIDFVLHEEIPPGPPLHPQGVRRGGPDASGITLSQAKGGKHSDGGLEIAKKPA